MENFEKYDPLSVTKINPPPLQEKFIERKNLGMQLDEAFKKTPHTVIISAPPGFGKTVFISSWIKLHDIRPVWLTLDAGDNGEIRFFSYLTASVSQANSKLGAVLEALLESPRNPSPESFAISFINEISKLKQKFVCVFDDYHTISSHNIHIFMQFLIENPSPHLLIIILSRIDPPLTLGRLRLQNRLTEFRIADLRLNREEMEEFFHTSMNITLSPHCYSILEERIDGWAAGLLLAAISVLKSPDKDAELILNEISGRNTYIIEYLTEEVLNSLSEDMRRFLYTTSVLDNFCDELCDAVMVRSDSRKVISEMVESNIFILPMDSQGKWFRYHPLFANYLQTNVGDDQKKRIFISAYQWFQSKNITDSAVSYAIRAGREELALPLITEEAEKIFNEGKYSVLLSWLDSFSPQILKEKPELSFYRAWGTFAAGSAEKALKIIKGSNDKEKSQISRRMTGRINVLKALISDTKHDPNKVDLIRKALLSIDPGDRYLKSILLIQKGNYNFNGNKLEKAEQFFMDALEIARELWNQFLIAVSVFNLSYVYIGLGKEEEAVLLCKKYLKELSDDSYTVSILSILYIPLVLIQAELKNIENLPVINKKTIETIIHFNFNFLLAVNISSAIKTLDAAAETSRIGADHDKNDISVKAEKTIVKSEHYNLPETISRRETDILNLLGEGLSNNDIADGLFISVGTVKWHLNNIFGKLDAANRIQAVNRARELHLIK